MNNLPSKSRYLIIGYSRSGTTVIHLALMGHPNISALTGELRPEPFYTKGVRAFTGGYCTDKEGQEGFSKIFDAITTVHSNENTICNGAKTACNFHGTARDIVRTLQTHLKDLKIIHIVRKDLVAQYGSAISGKRTGIMHSWYKGVETRKVSKIKIKKWPFIGYIINNFKMYEELKVLRKTHEVYELEYEEYTRNPDKTYKELFEFLGVPETEVSWLNSKKVMPPPSEYIYNYQVMQKLLVKMKGRFANNTIGPYVSIRCKIVGKLRSFSKLPTRLIALVRT